MNKFLWIGLLCAFLMLVFSACLSLKIGNAELKVDEPSEKYERIISDVVRTWLDNEEENEQ